MEGIVKNILVSIYQYFFASVISAFLFSFVYREVSKKGMKQTIQEWINEFKNNHVFRLVFLFSFYFAMLLYRTLICRSLWTNPVENVLGIWGLHRQDGTLYTENIENLILFVPMTFLYLEMKKKQLVSRSQRGMVKSVRLAFVVSFSIECIQLFFKLGTWQLSDIFFNSLGGALGALLWQIKDKWCRWSG